MAESQHIYPTEIFYLPNYVTGGAGSLHVVCASWGSHFWSWGTDSKNGDGRPGIDLHDKKLGMHIGKSGSRTVWVPAERWFLTYEEAVTAAKKKQERLLQRARDEVVALESVSWSPPIPSKPEPTLAEQVRDVVWFVLNEQAVPLSCAIPRQVWGRVAELLITRGILVPPTKNQPPRPTWTAMAKTEREIDRLRQVIAETVVRLGGYPDSMLEGENGLAAATTRENERLTKENKYLVDKVSELAIVNGQARDSINKLINDLRTALAEDLLPHSSTTKRMITPLLAIVDSISTVTDHSKGLLAQRDRFALRLWWMRKWIETLRADLATRATPPLTPETVCRRLNTLLSNDQVDAPSVAVTPLSIAVMRPTVREASLVCAAFESLGHTAHPFGWQDPEKNRSLDELNFDLVDARPCDREENAEKHAELLYELYAAKSKTSSAEFLREVYEVSANEVQSAHPPVHPMFPCVIPHTEGVTTVTNDELLARIVSMEGSIKALAGAAETEEASEAKCSDHLDPAPVAESGVEAHTSTLNEIHASLTTITRELRKADLPHNLGDVREHDR